MVVINILMEHLVLYYLVNPAILLRYGIFISYQYDSIKSLCCLNLQNCYCVVSVSRFRWYAMMLVSFHLKKCYLYGVNFNKENSILYNNSFPLLFGPRPTLQSAIVRKHPIFRNALENLIECSNSFWDVKKLYFYIR